MTFSNIILHFTLFAVCLAAQTLTKPVAETPLGAVQGWERISRDGRIYWAWTRIPYAKPPVGNLRLVAPQPIATRWEGILNATERMPDCIKNNGEGQEDCLYLNVFRPKITRRKLAVLVYIHGGGFQTGTSAPPEYADYIMDEDVLLVCVHYRLNGFGFMALGDKDLPGNFGLKDQALALKWVKENIVAFGVDPDNVTVFGESAGGASAHYLMNSPASEAYVTRAVSDSGTINHIWSMASSAVLKNRTLSLIHHLNCTYPTTKKMLECIQNLQAPVLLQAILKYSGEDLAKMVFLPTIEPEGTDQAFATEDLSLRPSEKPWITSITNGEYTLLMKGIKMMSRSYYEAISRNPLEYVKELIKIRVSDVFVVKNASEILHNYYFGFASPEGNFTQYYTEMNADSFFKYPLFFNIMKHRGPKWIQHLEYKSQYSGYDKKSSRSTSPVGVCGHGDQTLLYFNNQPTRQNAADYQVSKRLIKYLVNFAYFSDPTPSELNLNWNQYSMSNAKVLRITESGDFLEGSLFTQRLQIPFNLWMSAIGWDK